MAETIENPVREHLRRLDKKVDALAADLIDARTTLSGMMQLLASQEAHVLRVERRLGGIEKRLDMHDPAIPG
jgi:ParB-like chromosome segregation protein Spo0J